MSNNYDMDDFFKERLGSFEASPPKNGFEAIQKTLLRRKLIKYFSVGGTTVVAIVAVILFWQTNQNIDDKSSETKNNSANNLVENSEINKNLQIISVEKSIAKTSQNDGQKMLKSNVISKKLQTENITKNSQNGVPNLVLNTEKFNKKNIGTSSKKYSKINSKDGLTFDTKTVQSQISNLVNPKNSKKEINPKITNTENKKAFLNPILLKNAIILGDSVDFSSDSLASRNLPEFIVPFPNPTFKYTLFVASEWRSGNENPFPKKSLDYTMMDVNIVEKEELYTSNSSTNIPKSSHHYEQNLRHIGIQAERNIHKRIVLYWNISMTQLREKYIEKYPQINAPIIDISDNSNVASGVLPDSLNNYGVFVQPNVELAQKIQENEFNYLGITQGFGYDLMQRKNQTIRFNLEAGAHKLISGKSIYSIENQEIYSNTKGFNQLFLDWKTGVELRQRLNQHWDIIGGVQVRGFWNKESAGGILQGIQIGVHWR